MTDRTTETIGLVLSEPARRDAVHIAVAPVIANARLHPGQHIGIVPGLVGAAEPLVNVTENHIGIVDPFLQGPVNPGERFWMFLYPMTITSLRHEWTHPAFHAAEDDKIASEAWLRSFIADADCPDYATVLAAAIGNRDPWEEIGGDYLHFEGKDAHGAIPPEFWHHVEVVTGVRIPDDLRRSHFSCSC